MSFLKRYKRFDEVLAAFLPEKEIQVCRKAYLSYTRASFIFGEWLKSRDLHDKPMRKITAQDIADFSVYAAGLKYDKPTCEKFIMNLKVIFKYALKRDEIDKLPFDRDLIVFPKKGKDCSAALIPSHVVPQLLADIKEHDPQLFLACMLEFYCGIRPGREVRLVKVRNFDLKEGVLTIEAEMSKNGKTGRITMSDELVEICKVYGIADADPDLYVFGKNKHLDSRPLSENMLRFRFNKYRDKHGLSKDVKLYSFKHLGASYLVHSQTVDIEQLRQHLRHSNLSATQHYIKKVIGTQNNAIKTKFPNPLKQSI
jgi:site-specific recombinase XerD